MCLRSNPPPTYTDSQGVNFQSQSLADSVKDSLHSLSVGDPDEEVTVPMVHTIEKKSIKGLFKADSGQVVHTVIVRKMPRSHYLKHYAKDSEGKYVGTEKPAVDAGLVFVASQSTPEDVLAQVNKVAFGREHENNGYAYQYNPW